METKQTGYENSNDDNDDDDDNDYDKDNVIDLIRNNVKNAIRFILFANNTNRYDYCCSACQYE